MVEIYLRVKFWWNISIHGWDKTTSGFRKRTAAILEFYFRFRFWRMYSHWHVILRMSAKFRSNRTIGGWVMTSYRFFKMAAIESEMYFRVQVSSGYLFKEVEIYLPAKFRWDISIHVWDKTTSGFGKRTAAILEFYFRFRFWLKYSHRHVILHLSAKFPSNQTIVGGVMTSYRFFSRWPPAAILDLIWVMLDHPRSAIDGLSLILKFGVDPIYSFGDIAIFIVCRFGWKLPTHAHFWGVLGGYFPRIWSLIVLTPKRTILARKHVVWAIKRENRSSGST